VEGQPREKQTDGWYRELQDGRLEIMCSAPRLRIRVTAPEAQAWEVVDLFEKLSGLTVASERRPRRRPRQMAGQLSMIAMDELEVGDNGPA